MIRISTLALASVLALGLATAANADPLSGTWKVAVANDDTCTVTLQAGPTADAGTVTPGGNCTAGIAKIAKWKQTFRGVQLLTGSDELIAVAKPDGTAYQGKRVADDRPVELSRIEVGSTQ